MERARSSAFLSAIQPAAEQHCEATRQHLEKVWAAATAAIADGFSAFATALATSAREALEDEREGGREEGRQAIVNALLAAVRRMQAAESRSEWVSALADASAIFSERCIVFLVRGEFLDAAELRGFSDAARERIRGTRVRLDQAAAFRSAIEAGEPVIAQRIPGELSQTLAAELGPGEDLKAWLVPVRHEQTAIAVLYADGEAPAASGPGLELVAIAAGCTARERDWSREEREAAAERLPRQPREAPEWSRLSRQDQELHLEAQRFARVQVAEIRLHHDEAVRAGRAQRNLYGLLKREIDQAREAFRRQFVEASPTMIDYLHRELVRTLANDDPAALGTEYPGPLV